MSVGAFLFRVLLFIGALLILVCIAELWLRSRLFSDDPAYKEWRDPQLFTHRYWVDGHLVVSDDHDKLAVTWGILRSPVYRPHGMLGWCGTLDSTTLLPAGFDTATSGPVLLGAGWAEHAIMPVLDRTLSDSLPAGTDIAVAGFSLDQDLLLFQRTRDHFRGRKLLLHIDLDRIDRIQRTFVGHPKPWFTLAAYGGELHGVPVTTDIPAYLEAVPPDPGLYTYHILRTLVLQDTTMSTSAAEAAERELRELSKKLLFSLFSEALNDNITVSVYLEQNALGALADRRRWAVQDVCRDMGINCHVLGEEAGATGHRDQVRMMRIFLDAASELSGSPQYTSLSQLKALEEKPGSERTALEHAMMTILQNKEGSARVRKKATVNGVSFAMMVERDARPMIDHEQR